jgi:integrase
MMTLSADPSRHARRVAWPVEAWPEPDRRAWARALGPGSLLDDAGAAAGWREATRRSAVGAYGRFLAFLAAQNLLDPEGGPGERVTPLIIERYVAEVRATCSSVTVANYVAVLGMMVQAMVPGRDWTWLWEIHARLQRLATPSRGKRARVVPAADLVALGHDLMAEGEELAPHAARPAALAYRDGLMIALLASRPVRQANFLAVEIGRHLIRVADGWILRFEAGETKTRQFLELPLPAALNGPLARYLGHFRPLLLELGRRRFPDGRPRAAGQRLWVTGDGTPCTAPALQKLLEKRTRARFGRVINTHLFRDCAATSIAIDDPEHVRMAARLLGHATLRTTERHYVVADTRVALGRHHDLIQELRKPSRALPRAGRQR